MNQRPSQTPEFWQSQFQVTEEAGETLFHKFLESTKPSSIDEICLLLVKQVIEAEEQAIWSELKQGKVYQPDQHYEVGDRLVFPLMNLAMGTITSSKHGYNPVDGDFTVVTIEFEKISANFATDLKTPHSLSSANAGDSAEEDLAASIQKVYGQFQHLIRPTVKKAMATNSDYVEFGKRWFLADLLADVSEGLMNIVDAAIDINSAPLNVDTLIEQIELQESGSITEALRFSVNYTLERDDRFFNAGTDEDVLWYLERLKPPQVVTPPHNLIVANDLSQELDSLSGEMLVLLTEIDDETIPPQYARPLNVDSGRVTFVLTYPHRRSGTLPVLPSTIHLLPDADGRLVALKLIDKQSGDELVGWLVDEHHYIYGLAEWYQKYQLPVGAYIILEETENPLVFTIDFITQRTQQEWIRVATVKNDNLHFQMKRRALSCRYDELMVIGEEGSKSIDALWKRMERNNTPLIKMLTFIFPELMKLSAQHAVHTKTLYSAVNVIKRCPPGALLQELANNSSFVWMGHGYWTYKP